jgi:hypothetical protein
MYTIPELGKMVFFDIETVASHQSLDHLKNENPTLAQLWSKRCEYLRERFEENKQKSDAELFLEKAGLHAEFARIVCATFGRIQFNEGTPYLTLKTYSGEELEVLEGIDKVFNKFSNYKFVGHNIKRFDVPFICKRLLINEKSLPVGLQIQNLKPWEMPFVDTSDIWSFGAWQESFVSLELLATSLGLPTPKGDISGKDVTQVWYKERDVTRISTYCQADVLAVSQIILKLSGNPIVEDYQLQA